MTIIKFPVEKTSHIGHDTLMSLPKQDIQNILNYIFEQMEGEIRMGLGLLDDSDLPEDFDFHEMPFFALHDKIMQDYHRINACWFCNPDIDINETPFDAKTEVCLGCAMKIKKMQEFVKQVNVLQNTSSHGHTLQ